MPVPARERFLTIYANLPMGVRKEIIVVADDEPISWEVAYLEVDQRTSLGDAILTKLEKMEII